MTLSDFNLTQFAYIILGSMQATVHREITGHNLQSYIQVGSLLLLSNVLVIIDRKRGFATLSITRNNLCHIFLPTTPNGTTHVTVERDRIVTNHWDDPDQHHGANANKGPCAISNVSVNLKPVTSNKKQYQFRRDTSKCNAPPATTSAYSSTSSMDQSSILVCLPSCKSDTTTDSSKQDSEVPKDLYGVLAKTKRYITIIEKQLPYKKLSAESVLKDQAALSEVNNILLSIIKSHK